MGVPPPMYSATGRSPARLTASAVASISRSSASRYGSTSPMDFSTDWLTKLQ